MLGCCYGIFAKDVKLHLVERAIAGTRFAGGAAPVRQCSDFDHPYPAGQRYHQYVARRHVLRGTFDATAIAADMPGGNQCLRRAARRRKAQEPQEFVDPHAAPICISRSVRPAQQMHFLGARARQPDALQVFVADASASVAVPVGRQRLLPEAALAMP